MDELAKNKIIWCPNCHSEKVEFQPAPTQTVRELNVGPFTANPEPDDSNYRMSPPDEDGKRYLLRRLRDGEAFDYWPAELNCTRCTEEGDKARRMAHNWSKQFDSMTSK